MSAYEALAEHYDQLTADVGYARRADYLERLFRRSRIPVRTVLDLACGTGTMTALLARRGYEMIAVDASPDMLAEAREKAAELDGATGSYIFFHIKLRYLSPTVLFVTILSIINSFKVFREIYLLTGDYPYDGLYMLQHFMNNMFKHLDYQRLSAAAVFLAIVIVILVALLFLIENYFGKDVEG